MPLFYLQNLLRFCHLLWPVLHPLLARLWARFLLVLSMLDVIDNGGFGYACDLGCLVHGHALVDHV